MKRLDQLSLALNIAASLIVLRLVHLQLIEGARYRELSDKNRLRVVPEQSPRGLITDRHGEILADNHTVFRVAVIPQELKDTASVLKRVSELTGTPITGLKRALSLERSLAFIPAVIVPHVKKEVALRLEEDRWQLPGLLVKPDTIRHYPMGSVASHLLGYLAQPTADEMPLLKQYGVRPQEMIGRMGLEQALDHALRGRSGGLLVEVNHRARQVRVVAHRMPEPGSTVALTIDAQLQSLIERAFGSQSGACVVLVPQTGEILAMVSVPGFAPEAFSSLDVNTVRKYLNDPQAPLMNRSTVGVYQPGSIVKPITAASALSNKLVSPSTTVNCRGSMRIGDRVFHCWNRDGHGPIALTEALMQSCNVYFMQLGQRLGMMRLRQAMEMIGFSRRTGYPLEEQPGHLPERRLTEGEVALLAIGQGEILITPLQAAIAACVFANDGWYIQPWLVRSVGNSASNRRLVRREVGWSHGSIDVVRSGMLSVVQDPRGTAHRAFNPLISIAGKTGTAQTHVLGMSHGWFVGFCPYDKARVAMAIVAEYGGSGGDLPAEIARTVCEYVSASSETL